MFRLPGAYYNPDGLPVSVVIPGLNEERNVSKLQRLPDVVVHVLGKTKLNGSETPEAGRR